MKTVKNFLKSIFFIFLLINMSFAKGKTSDINTNIKSNKIIKENNQAESLYYFNMAKAYEKEKYIDKAIENYQLAIKTNPDLETAYSNLGLIYAEKGDYKNSIEIFKKYLKFSDNSEKNALVKEFINQMIALEKK